MPTLTSTHARLARWLGPWTSAERAPRGVLRRALEVPASGGRPAFEAWLYEPPRRTRGALLMTPGLHFAGPADPRLDRLCRVLADSGVLVLAPFLPDFISLQLAPTLVDDEIRCFERFLEVLPPGARPGVFSISFGSLPALRLCAHPEHAARVGGLLVFGGYADLGQTLAFCLGAGPSPPGAPPRDPLNKPVVFMNLMGQIQPPPAHPEALSAAWRRYVQRTWGRPELKVPGAWEPIAREVSLEVPEACRELFLQGCGAAPGHLEVALDALGRRGDLDRYLDPRPHLAGVRAPVHLVHGLDDDVIPHAQLDALAAAFPAHHKPRTWLTGLYGHTGKAGFQLAGLARELRTMAGVLDAIVQTATRGWR